MMKTTKLGIIAFLFVLLVMPGCDIFNSRSPIDNLNPGDDITDVENTIDESTGTIGKETKEIREVSNRINQEATQIERKSPPEIDSHIASIRESTQEIIDHTNTIDMANLQLVDAKELLSVVDTKIGQIDDARKQAEKERDEEQQARIKAEEERDSQFHKMLRWLILGCIVLTGVFMVVFFMYGSKMGIMGAIGCIAVMSVAIFVETYFTYLIIFGGVLLAAMIGFMIWHVWNQKRAFREVVDTVEVTQDNMDDALRKRLFGADGEVGLMNTIQSKATMDMVRRTKQRIPGLWKYIIEKNGRSPIE